MRKKSHISLAGYIVNSVDIQDLAKHKKAFYLGNILPDCKPTFLTTKHEYNTTFEKLKEDMQKLTIANDNNINNKRAFWRNLGQIIHYIADYFTFPHNDTYEGSLKDHCIYEKHLKYRLREYIKSGEAERNSVTFVRVESLEALFQFIAKAHEEYLKFKRSVQEDCQYIVNMALQVVASIVYLLEKQMNIKAYHFAA
ncbi:zinc dependent phospholipase C family protein [Konateibacter massiliensis]|uniref:zinc dependent phospholipase C family protein n=1 Tax=Konateibacter massiliensis TaxID=2002841 RepID=UPI000C1564B7|nr:zinc dependent phospholipase C family protein [Konateibacter massiliensis]